MQTNAYTPSTMTNLSTTHDPPTTCPVPSYNYYHQPAQSDIKAVEKPTIPSVMTTNTLSVPAFQIQNHVYNVPHEEPERIAAAQAWARSLTTAEALAISKLHIILYNDEMVQISATKHRADVFLDLSWSASRNGQDEEGEETAEPQNHVEENLGGRFLSVEIAYMDTRGYGEYLEKIYNGVVRRMNEKLKEAGDVQTPQDQLAMVFGAWEYSYLYLF